MSCSTSSLSLYLDTYNDLTLVQSMNGNASSNSVVEGTASRIANILSANEDSSTSTYSLDDLKTSLSSTASTTAASAITDVQTDSGTSSVISLFA
jgi:hypothetical protein